MLLFGWKNRWNRVADQTYTLVADKEHKVVKDVRTHQDALCGIDNELKRLQVRERFWIGVWAMTAAGLIILFFTRSPATQKPLLKTPVPSCKQSSEQLHTLKQLIHFKCSTSKFSHIRTRPHLRNATLPRIRQSLECFTSRK